MDAQKTAFVLRKAWTLYSVTPLYGFRRGLLRDYARLLSAFIAAEKQKGLAVEVGVELDIKVALSSLAELRGSELDQAGLLVQVRGLLWLWGNALAWKKNPRLNASWIGIKMKLNPGWF